MTSTRIKGKRLALTLGTPGTEVWQDVRGLTLQSDEPDDPTFGEVADGAAKWLLAGNAIQSTDAASFWSYVWENSGQRVPYTYAVHGNAIPSETQPHFVGHVYIGRKPSLGGEVGSAGYEFEFEWECDGEPTKVTVATP
ncbi:hypothetical protein M2317_000067 [Microbacterium sp. ZKA21]|uniref:hypothetical protein n=1 Tax=Microbacterium sp. ZKA21 TaxID=3381694 RepID=UPI003D20DD4A